jgi:hypothetical protein
MKLQTYKALRKRCVLKDKQDDVLAKDKTMDNVQKLNICKLIHN